MLQPCDVTVAILAGGTGSRMGGAKSRLTVHAKPILDYLLDRWNWPGPTLLVTAPGFEHPPGHQRFTREVVDAVAGEGPLRGIDTALDNCDSDALVVTTCDMPMIEREHLEATAAQLRGNCGFLWMHQERIESFPSAYQPQTARPLIAQRLAARKLSVQTLTTEPGFATLPVPREWPACVWLNLNTPADLQDFIRRSSSSDRTRP